MVTRDGKAMENPALAIQRKSAEAMARASRALGLNWQPMEGAEPAGPHGAAPSAKCGGTNRQGEHCGNASGYKTDHPGSGNCHFHGGSSPNGRAHALTQQAERLLYKHDAAPVTNPLEALQALAGRALALEQVIGEKVNELRSLRYETEGGGEQIRGELQVLERAMDRCGRMLTDIAKLGIEDKLAGIRQRTLDMLERALDAALEASGAPLDGKAKAREAFKRQLKVVA